MTRKFEHLLKSQIMKTVLFICTGNIFRSMTAEHAFRAQIGDAPYCAKSAGLTANPQEMYAPVRARIMARGVDPSAHQQQKLTLDMLNRADLSVAMGLDHCDSIRETFDREVPLFNRVALGKDEPIKDIWEIVPNWGSDEEGRRTYALYVVDTIWNTMPDFIGNMDDFMT